MPLRSEQNFEFLFKTPLVFHFIPTQIFCLIFSFSCFFFVCRNPNPRSTLMDPRKSIMAKRQRSGSTSWAAPPCGRLHLVGGSTSQRILIGSFLEKPSESTMSHYSTSHLFRNEVFQPLTHSSTSSSRTAAGKHSMHPLSLEWPRLCGNSTPICHSRLAPPFLFEASGLSLVPK